MAYVNYDPAQVAGQLKQQVAQGKFAHVPEEVRGGVNDLIVALEKAATANSKAKDAITSYQQNAGSEALIGTLQTQAGTANDDNHHIASKTAESIQDTSDAADESSNQADDTETGNSKSLTMQSN